MMLTCDSPGLYKIDWALDNLLIRADDSRSQVSKILPRKKFGRRN